MIRQAELNDVLGRWNNYAKQQGDHTKAVAGLSENEREALFDVTNAVRSRFVFSSSDMRALEDLKNRLQQYEATTTPDENSVANIQRALFNNDQFARSALRDRLSGAREHLKMLESPKHSRWGKPHVSQITLQTTLQTLLDRAANFDLPISREFSDHILNSAVYRELNGEVAIYDVTPLIPKVSALLNELDTKLL